MKKLALILAVFLLMGNLAVPVVAAEKAATASKISLREACDKSGCFILWDAVDDAKSYEIFRSEKKVGGYKKISTVKRTKYTPLHSEGTYYFKVRAVLKDGSRTKFSSALGYTA